MVKTLELADKLERVAPKPLGDRAAAELRRLEHNNRVLMNALWKACGDNKTVVNMTIASQGELK